MLTLLLRLTLTICEDWLIRLAAAGVDVVKRRLVRRAHACMSSLYLNCSHESVSK